MFNAKRKLWQWGPIDGKPVYPDPWYKGQSANRKLFPPGWPLALVWYEGGKFTYLTEYGQLYRRGRRVFTQFILHDANFRTTYHAWLKAVERLMRMNNKIFSHDLSRLSQAQLYELVLKWYSLYAEEFWGIGLLPELANFGGEALLKKYLSQHIKQQPEYVVALQNLSAPDKLSFYQQEELNLLRLRSLKPTQHLRKKLKNHQRKYYWLLNSYADTRVLPVAYFKKRLLALSRAEAVQKIDEVRAQVRATQRQKTKLVKRLGLNSQAIKIAKRLSFCIWWQDKRKTYIFQANHAIDVMLREVGKRYGISITSLRYYRFGEILNLIRTHRPVNQAELVARQHKLLVIWRPTNGALYVSGNRAQHMFKPHQIQTKSRQTDLLKGLAVNTGLVQGRVRLLLTPKEANTLKRGEILVTTMTSPDFIVAMRRAAAIVTDVGGLTSHAAIVSRELKIPCIVNTRMATHLLKTGDMVEVNAKTGIVRKIV